MGVNDILEIIAVLPRYIQYIFPGYITIWVYYFCIGITLKDTRALIVKSIVISYLYVVFVNTLFAQFNELEQNIVLFILAVLVAYISSLLVEKEKEFHFLRRLGINTSLSLNEIDAIETNSKTGIWICVYLKNCNLMYEGFILHTEMAEGNRRFICLCNYRKFIIDTEGKLKNLEDHSTEREEQVILYFEDIARIEKRKI